MAERIDILSPPRYRIYPWEKWSDGNMWRIRRGTDFAVSGASMASIIRTRAKTQGLTATCRVVDAGDAVEFQFAETAAAA